MLSTRFLSHAFQLKTKFILVIRDQSGSMYDYKKNLDLACINLETNYGSSSSEFGLHFVAFAGPGYLGDSPRIMDLQHISGNTSIAQAFRRAIEILSLLAKHGRFDEVVIVFISDGEDNHKEQCEAELQQLQGEMPCKSKLFCVGCRGFPTGFVAGTPFKIFGRGNDECEAPVIACPSPEDVPFVFAELEKLIESKGKAQILPVEELASTADPALLVRAAQCSYNRAVNRSMYFKQDSELEAFRDCKSYLGSVMSKLVERVRAVKRTDAHVLLSDDLKAVPRPAQLTALAANVEIVRRLHNQASACLDMAERGEMISKLDDESKLEIAGLAGRLGALTGVVMKYHRPEAERIKKSLFKFLEEYPEHASLPPAKFDDQIKVDDNLTLCDLFRDAKSVLPVVSRYWTIQDIVERFPFVGYPVECTYISKGAAMNPWLVQVVAFDPARIIPMQALSLEFPWNCMIIIPSFNPGSDTSYVKYAASCLLYGGGLFQNEAYWSLLAAGVTHLLECNVTYSLEWRGMISALYAQLRRCFQSVYPWAHSCAYLEKLKAPSEFRKCLVSEHPLLSADHADLRLTCPHLTKFVFGLWYILTDPNAEKGTLLTGGQLRSMYIAFLVEFFYRAGQRLVWTPVDCKVDTEQLLEPLVYRRMANLSAQAPTLSRVCDMFWPCVREYVETLRKSPELLVDAPALSEEALNRASHYQFNWDSIKGIFAGLFYCGKDDLEGEFTTALTQRELARILLLAQKHGNLERNTSAEYDQPLPEVFIYFLFNPSGNLNFSFNRTSLSSLVTITLWPPSSAGSTLPPGTTWPPATLPTSTGATRPPQCV